MSTKFFGLSPFFLSSYPFSPISSSVAQKQILISGRDHRKDAGRINRGTDFYAMCVFRRNNRRIPVIHFLAS